MAPLHQRSLWAWGLFLLAALLAPLCFDSGLGLSVLSQIGIAMLAMLSYNVLYGQGGMLSFGHAVYSGMGAYLTIHVLRVAGGGDGLVAMPVSLLPLVGGAAGLATAALLGWFSTRRAGTTFAMITLGLAELVFAGALMFTEFFGGESGVSANRVVAPAVAGISFGPAIEVYYLIAVYTVLGVALLYGFTQTPLGRLLNAVRDKPERVAFLGYSTRRIRYTAFMVAGFFAGVAGGLAALHFEIVTAEVLGTARSGSYLLFTVVGGSAVFWGPLVGAVLMVFSTVLLSAWTPAWSLYLGLVFIVTVMVAPGGVAGALLACSRFVANGGLRRGGVALWLCGLSAGLCLLSAAVCIEMFYHLQWQEAMGARLVFLGWAVDAHHRATWLLAVGSTAAAGGLWWWSQRRLAARLALRLNEQRGPA